MPRRPLSFEPWALSLWLDRNNPPFQDSNGAFNPIIPVYSKHPFLTHFMD